MLNILSAPGLGTWSSSGEIVIGVRGMPERDIESLGVMGWGLDAARKFFHRRRRRRRRRPPKGGVWQLLLSSVF